jgi:hypothetical protein
MYIPKQFEFVESDKSPTLQEITQYLHKHEIRFQYRIVKAVYRNHGHRIDQFHFAVGVIS